MNNSDTSNCDLNRDPRNIIEHSALPPSKNFTKQDTRLTINIMDKDASGTAEALCSS